MRRGINSQEVSNGLLRGWLIIVGHRYTAYNGVFAGCFFQTFSFPAIGHCNKVGKGRAIACIMSFLGKLFSSKDSTSKGDEDNEDESILMTTMRCR